MEPQLTHPCIQPSYRIQNLPTTLRFHLAVDLPKDSNSQLYLNTFPYVDEKQRLRVWDVARGELIPLVGRNVVDGGMRGEEVRKRSSRFFNWAQSLGYWADVQQ